MVAMHRKVVARYVDGRIVRGFTFDFDPSQRRFHVFEGPTAMGPSTQVLVRDLKAVFFVRDLVLVIQFYGLLALFQITRHNLPSSLSVKS